MASDSFSGLRQFEVFDAARFFEGKILVCKGCAPLQEYADGKATGKVLGTKVTVGIMLDETSYKPYPDGSTPDNSCKSFDVKLIGQDGVDIPRRARVTLINPTGSIYAVEGSKRRDHISIAADEVRVIPAKKAEG